MVGLMPADGGPGPEQVVELLEVRVVVASWGSRPCCRSLCNLPELHLTTSSAWVWLFCCCSAW